MTNVMTYKGYQARIEYDDDDGIMFGKIAGITDSVSFHGESVAELKAAFREAVDDYVETCAKVGKEPQKSFSGKMMLRVPPEVHRSAALAAELAGVSLNQWGEDALRMSANQCKWQYVTVAQPESLLTMGIASDVAIAHSKSLHMDVSAPVYSSGRFLATKVLAGYAGGGTFTSKMSAEGRSVKRPKKTKAGE